MGDPVCVWLSSTFLSVALCWHTAVLALRDQGDAGLWRVPVGGGLLLLLAFGIPAVQPVEWQHEEESSYHHSDGAGEEDVGVQAHSVH